MKKAFLFLTFFICLVFSASSQNNGLEIVISGVNAECPQLLDNEGSVLNRLYDDGENVILDFTISDELFSGIAKMGDEGMDFIKQAWLDSIREMAQNEDFAEVVIVIYLYGRGMGLEFKPTSGDDSLTILISNEEVGSLIE